MVRPDILLLNETKLRTQRTLKIPNYTIYRKDGELGQGGVVLAVKNSLPHDSVEAYDPEVRNLQLLTIVLKDQTHVTTWYNRPIDRLTQQKLSKVMNLARKHVVAGDLNARHRAWRNHCNNRNGITLNSFVENNNVVLMGTEEPTHIPTNGTTPTYIDVVLAKNCHNIVPPSVLNDLPSDHQPVLFALELYGERDQEAREVPAFQKANWRRYKNLMNQYEPKINIETKEHLEDAIKEYTEAILAAAKEAIPMRKVTNKTAIPLPCHILKLITCRNKARMRYQKYRMDIDRNDMRTLNGEIKAKIKAHRQTQFKEKLESLKVGDGSIWKFIRRIKKPYVAMPAIRENGVVIMQNDNKAEAIADYFEKQHELPPEEPHTGEVVARTVQTHERAQTQEQTTNNASANNKKFKTSAEEIKNIIKFIRNDKAPGADKVHNRLIKQLPEKSIKQLEHIINSAIKLKCFPNTWKAAVVIPVPKPAKPKNLVNSYRPISLLSGLSKIYERILLKQILNHAEEARVIPDHQFGFREGHSSLHQVARLAALAGRNYNQKKHMAIVLIDLEKAFDRVWHLGLLNKLINKKFPANLVEILRSYLEGRSFKVRVNNVESTSREAIAGVPQGSVLGPILYSIFVSDVPEYPGTGTATFADDTAFFADSKYLQIAIKKIQNRLHGYVKYLEKWRITMNADKTQLAILTMGSRKKNVKLYIKINGKEVKAQRIVKYLGIFMDARLNFREQVNENIRKTSAAIKATYSLLKRGYLSQSNKKLIYTAILRPILLYGSELMRNISKSNAIRLQRTQNKCLRLVTGKGRYTKIIDLHRIADVPYIQELKNKAASRFYNATVTNSNPLIRSITEERHQEGRTHKHRYLHQELPIYQIEYPGVPD